MTDREQDHLLATATDRFERRVSEEVGAVRVAMIEGDAATRHEISNVRLEIGQVRIDIAEQFGASRVHSETRHRELFKWAFVFWVGQAIAVAGIFTAFR
jgi:hypothetical protein